MDINRIAPVIKEVLQDTLSEKRYPFGFSKNRGIGDKVASGRLRDSVDVNVSQNRGNEVIEIYMESYGPFVQSGRLPGKKGVPISAIEQWIKDRKLLGRNKKGRFITRRSFAFAIQQNIKKFGIRPSNFLDISIQKLENDPRIIESLEESTFEELVNILEGI
jgi:hypothetical protein